VIDSALLLLAILACLLSGSRAGLAGAIVFAIAMMVRKPLYVLVFAFLVWITVLAVPQDWLSEMDQTVTRQSALAEPHEEENLSGRVAIWEDRLAFLNEEPTRWIIGSGFGSAVESGNSAHMLYLQLIVEVGLIGLAAFLFVMSTVLRHLRRGEAGVQPILWATVAFLFSSLTQETFYPSPAAGHFLGFYLSAVAIALRSGADRVPRNGGRVAGAFR
jgi:O-antigen ligase